MNLAAGTLIYIPFIKKVRTYRKKNSCVRSGNWKLPWMRNSILCGCRISTGKHTRTGRRQKLLTADLQYALTKGELQLHYQPQMYRDGRLYGCEALLRWNYMGHTYIYPPLIIALAVQSGFIDSLGLAIIRMACADMKQAERECGFPITFSVNILPLQLENRGFAPECRGDHKGNRCQQ